MTEHSQLVLDGATLDLAALRNLDSTIVATLAEDARARMQVSVDAVHAAMSDGRAHYGINTGFGAFARTRISADQLIDLQYNLVRSHACGVGAPLPASIVRRIMVLKANSLAVGVSGIRPAVVDTLLALLAADVLPVIPERGSVGASGDLAPLAHLALALIGEGEADQGSRRLEGAAVLEAAGVKPIELRAKEGLALLNGTQVSTALAIEAWARADGLLHAAIVAGALSVEALAGSHRPFDTRISDVRNQAGQQYVAGLFRSLLTESDINSDHAGCDRVQDPYALRCMPQVLGAVADTIEHAAQILEREANGVSDNPLVFGDDILSGGNFHAAPVGFVADFLAVALTEIGNMSERRVDLLTRKVNPRLEMFLTRSPGLESGYMIAQVSAAALASENKTLAHPASVDTIPTSAGQEDHVSMAPWAGLKAMRIADNVAHIVAIELMAAAAAIDCARPLKTTPPLEEVMTGLRSQVPAHSGDRRLDQDIAAAAAMVAAGQFDARR